MRQREREWETEMETLQRGLRKRDIERNTWEVGESGSWENVEKERESRERRENVIEGELDKVGTTNKRKKKRKKIKKQEKEKDST